MFGVTITKKIHWRTILGVEFLSSGEKLNEESKPSSKIFHFSDVKNQ